MYIDTRCSGASNYYDYYYYFFLLLLYSGTHRGHRAYVSTSHPSHDRHTSVIIFGRRPSGVFPAFGDKPMRAAPYGGVYAAENFYEPADRGGG
jgi:hypothetical protein